MMLITESRKLIIFLSLYRNHLLKYLGHLLQTVPQIKTY